MQTVDNNVQIPVVSENTASETEEVDNESASMSLYDSEWHNTILCTSWMNGWYLSSMEINETENLYKSKRGMSYE